MAASEIKTFLFLCACCLLWSGCVRVFAIKENLAEGQIVETSVTRKPSGEKSLGTFPKYDDFLQGYILGGLVAPDGTVIQGVTVKVLDESGSDSPRFVPGITDESGTYKIRFSLPIQWDRIDFTGSLVSESGWKINVPKNQFRLYFNRKSGVLAYYPTMTWLTVTHEKVLKKQAAESNQPIRKKIPKKPSSKDGDLDELLSDFGFGE